ncbi:MAG: hypothetical protein IJX77_10055 [Ruminococcus sp.]|nr:hypothetical protein [Ruminococcus sp.]
MSEYTSKYTSSEIDERLGRTDEFDLHAADMTAHLESEEKARLYYALGQAAVNRASLGLQKYNLLKNTAETTTVNGVTFTVNEDKTVTVNGTATEDAEFFIGYAYLNAGVSYSFSGYPAECSEDTYCLQLAYNTAWCTLLDGLAFTPPFSFWLIMRILVRSGQTADNLIFKPMVFSSDTLYYSSEELEYQPYTDDLQTQLSTARAELAENTAMTQSAVGLSKKNLLKNTASSVTKNGITFTVNTDGSVTAKGTASAAVSLDIGKISLGEGREYILSGCPEDGAEDTYYMYGLYTSNWVGIGGRDIGEGYKFTASPGEIVFRIYIGSGVTVSGLTFSPMVRCSEISDGNYEQYTDDLQSQINALLARINALEGSA